MDWFHHMRRGDFAGAWAISDEILRTRVPRWDVPRHEQSIWDGTPLAGKRVLIRCYHGLGDTIMFARFIPSVESIAREVIVWVQPTLIPLLETMRTRATFLPLHDGVPEVDYDVDVEIMELAHVFRATPETLPRPPYLFVEPATHVRGVGVAWRAGDWDPNRSIPVDLFDGLPYVSLDITNPDADTPLKTARLMRALDLVVTVDSMTAHLAGALAVPTWTLLPRECDWRWMDGRDDTPWYPTMRLFRYARETMADESKKSLEDWGIDVDKFKERAKESLENARGDLSEITGTLRHTLVQAKDILVGLQKNGSPAAAELKSGFERAWHEIEAAFKAARERAKGEPTTAESTPPDPPSPS